MYLYNKIKKLVADYEVNGTDVINYTSFNVSLIKIVINHILDREKNEIS